MFIEENLYLEHYGKKGMTWGVRNKTRGANSSSGKSLGLQKKKLQLVLASVLWQLEPYSRQNILVTKIYQVL